MKKALLIAGLLVLAITLIGGAGSVYAQAPTPETPEAPYYGPGGRGMRGAAGMGGAYASVDGEYGPMHEVMISSMAEALGLDAADLEARLEAGETMYAIAASLGFSSEEISELLGDAREQAIQQAVADGLLTAEQAEWMLSRMQGMGAGGYGFASGNCDGTGQPVGRGMGSQRGHGAGMRGGN